MNISNSFYKRFKLFSGIFLFIFIGFAPGVVFGIYLSVYEMPYVTLVNILAENPVISEHFDNLGNG